MKNPFSYAYQYADLGLKVFPLHSIKNFRCTCGNPDCTSAGKHPRLKGGFKDATINQSVIHGWLNQFELSNVGLATGSTNNIFVLDIDPRNSGFESIKEFDDLIDACGETPYVDTGSGGIHIFFASNDPDISSKTGVRPGIDIKSNKGYVVAPPSRHLSGEIYKWRYGFANTEVPFAKLPDWLITIGRGKRSGLCEKTDFHEWLDKLDPHKASILSGFRNDTVLSIGGHLLQKDVNFTLAAALLMSFNKTNVVPPLPDEELHKIIQYLCRKELERRGGNE